MYINIGKGGWWEVKKIGYCLFANRIYVVTERLLCAYQYSIVMSPNEKL